MRDIADEHGVFVALANLVGSEAGKQFPGCAMLAGPKGDVRARGPLWEEAIVTATIDLADVTRARADMPLLADLETMLPHLRDTLARLDAGTPHLLSYDGMEALAESMGAPATRRRNAVTGRSRTPSVRRDAASASCARGRRTAPPPLEIDGAMVEDWLVHFLRDEMGRRGLQRRRSSASRAAWIPP